MFPPLKVMEVPRFFGGLSMAAACSPPATPDFQGLRCQELYEVSLFHFPASIR